MFGMLPLVQAQEYSQPMLGVSWDTHEISISIPTSPSWAPSAINAAIDDWNNAQLWFIHTYFPSQTGAQFLLNGNPNSSDSQVTILYVPDVGQYWTGNTKTPTSGTVSNETMLVVLSRLQTHKDLVQVVEHELGHVLGLDHTQISSDLMYAAQDAYSGGELLHPSTLNLYAIYLLGKGCSFSTQESVTLPSQIPYVEWYPTIPPSATNQPQTIPPPDSCPSQSPLWSQPAFIIAVVAGLVIVFSVYLNSRKKKIPRPSRFLES
jgi:matrixin